MVYKDQRKGFRHIKYQIAFVHMLKSKHTCLVIHGSVGKYKTS